MSLGSALDLGSHRVRYAVAKTHKDEVSLQRYLWGTPESGETAAEGAQAMFSSHVKRGAALRVGLTGSDLMMRYLPVPVVEDWRLERLMDFEIREIEERSGSTLASSYNLLPVPQGLDDEDTMLLGLVREDLLEETMAQMPSFSVQAFSPNAIALYNAYLALGDHEPCTTLLASLGNGTLDLALVHGTDLYFARSVSTSLSKRNQTLATTLGINPQQAEALIHKHCDLSMAISGASSTDVDRVTRPLLPMYEALPTLLSGVVTLCKAQARLNELNLERVLLTGGGAETKGITEFLSDRMRVDVSVWNPSLMVDVDDLPAEEAGQLEQDGCGATIAIGLALGAADSNLYALEILTTAAKKKREFAERGVFQVLMGVAAAAFIAVNMMIMSGLADEAEAVSRSLRRDKQKNERNHQSALELLDKIEQRQIVFSDLRSRKSIVDSSFSFMMHLEDNLPDSLWVESMIVQLVDGKDWGRNGERVPVVLVRGRAEEDVRGASRDFAMFTGSLEKLVPGGQEAIKASSNTRGKSLEWSLQANMLKPLNQEQAPEGL
ncbi:MAG: pilus assembly protein PilM [Planctomycetota bacterium]|jgi:Tfp pilus assembly PilM family ATPase|nr:pilus assembly protein PilM [Planctomycetota bacterium]